MRLQSVVLFPLTLGHTLVPILHAVVLVESRDRTEGLVVQASQAERFVEVFLEIVKGAQVGGEGRSSLAAGRLKKLLVTTVDQGADFAVHDDAGGFDHADFAIRQLQSRRAAVAADLNPA